MTLDLAALKAAVASHTTETQRLLNANAAHVAAAVTAASEIADAQASVASMAAEVAAQAQAIQNFNDANHA